LLATAGGPSGWYDHYAGNFLLLGKLAYLAPGDSFKIPPEVSVQCFFGREWGHFDHLRLQEIGSN
jgi:hypothetical protein